MTEQTDADKAIVRRLVNDVLNGGDLEAAGGATGRRFTNIDEINRYRIHNGRITESWTLEDNLERLTQLGLLLTD